MHFRYSHLPALNMLFNASVKMANIPAITHLDGSSKIQTVSRDWGLFHSLLSGFRDLTSTPLVLNTSFNGPGEPIVESPVDALRLFCTAPLDVLNIKNIRIVQKLQR